MHIHKASKQDLPAIRMLMQSYGKMVVGPEHVNQRDIALCARDDEGRLVGFLYMGLMAQNKVGYLDKFCVDRGLAGKGVGSALAMACFEAAKKRGVREVFGVIRQDEFHEKSAMNALKMAFGAHKEPYTYVSADLNHMAAELMSLGV
jgi:N-acetylglutamate synthase-like GNAT family acetyltransferase